MRERHSAVRVFVVSILSIYLGGGFIGDADFPFVANSVTKDGLFLALSLLAIADMRRFGWLAWLVMLGHAMLAVTLLPIVVTGNVNMAPTRSSPSRSSLDHCARLGTGRRRDRDRRSIGCCTAVRSPARGRSGICRRSNSRS